jgi:3-carboxy-cis,cis-muconate cycloisomerase
MGRRAARVPRNGVLRVLSLFGPKARLERILEFESALARALARAGVIDKSASAAIASACEPSRFDLAAIERGAVSAGNEAIPIVEQLRALVEQTDANAVSYVHWGATSQDALDTALVLQLRAAFDRYDAAATYLSNVLIALIETHASTPMVGRTWLQHAVPTTFGFKVAGWLDAVERHRARLESARRTSCVLQFGGAVGHLGALGASGPSVAAALADELRLPLPAISWHSTRDRVVEVATTFALLTGTLGKIARDVSLMAQSEIAEVREPAESGRGRSSTMPQKRNPVGCAGVLAASLRVPALASTMLSAMVQEHERSLGGWQAEWETLPQICVLAFDALTRMTEVLACLEVNVERMAENLEATNGLIFAEAVTFALVPRVGRAAAAAIVERAMRATHESGVHFRHALLADGDARAHLSASDVERLFDPRSHLATAASMALAVAARGRRSMEPA